MRDVPTGMDAPRRIQRKADSGPHCGEGRCSTRRTLMQEGLASERRAESGRALLVRLTAKGHKYRERLIKERRAAEEKLREVLTLEEIASLLGLLKVVAELQL